MTGGTGPTSDAKRTLTIGYYAAAADAVGKDSEELMVSARTVGGLRDALILLHGSPLREVLEVSSFLLGDEVVRDPARSLGDITAVDVLPPFAGG